MFLDVLKRYKYNSLIDSLLEQEPRIVHYAGPIKPWDNARIEFAISFWEVARGSVFYEPLLRKFLGQQPQKKTGEMQQEKKEKLLVRGNRKLKKFLRNPYYFYADAPKPFDVLKYLFVLWK